MRSVLESADTFLKHYLLESLDIMQYLVEEAKQRWWNLCVQTLYGNVIFLYFEKYEVSQGLQLNIIKEIIIELLSLQTKVI